MLLALASLLPTPASRDFFHLSLAIGFSNAKVMNIKLKGFGQLAPCVFITAIDTDMMRIIFTTMYFAFANLIDRRQQGIDINVNPSVFITPWSLADFIITTSLGSERASLSIDGL